jgi:hypothetical protein
MAALEFPAKRISGAGDMRARYYEYSKEYRVYQCAANDRDR